MCCPNILGCLVFHWRVVRWPGLHSEETDPTFPCGSLSVTPLSRVGLCGQLLSACWVWSGSGLCGFCACFCNCCEFLCTAALLHAEMCPCGYPHHWLPNLGNEGCIYSREDSILSLWFSVWTAICCRGRLLWWGRKWCGDLLAQQRVNELF